MNFGNDGQGLRIYKQDIDARIVVSRIMAMKSMLIALRCSPICAYDRQNYSFLILSRK